MGDPYRTPETTKDDADVADIDTLRSLLREASHVIRDADLEISRLHRQLAEEKAGAAKLVEALKASRDALRTSYDESNAATNAVVRSVVRAIVARLRARATEERVDWALPWTEMADEIEKTWGQP